MSVPLRLLYGLNADGTPRRISMFPPSYADRARAREMRRRGSKGLEITAPELGQATAQEPTVELRPIIIEKGRLIIPRGPKRSKAQSKTVAVVTPPAAPTTTSSAVQTDMTYCVHECGQHAKTDAPSMVGAKGKGKSGRDGKEGKQAKAADDTQKKGKARQTSERGEDEENEAGPESSESEADASSSKKVRINAPSPKQQAKGGPSNVWEPSSLPFLSALLPKPDQMSKPEKQAFEQYTRQSRESLAAARKMDEEEARGWTAHQLAATHSGALRWLRERDSQRQTCLTNHLALGHPGSFAAFKAGDHCGSLPWTNTAANMGFTASPNPNKPLWSEYDSQGHYGWSPFVASSFPLVVFQDCNNVYTQDGRPVKVISRTGARGCRQPFPMAPGNEVRGPQDPCGGLVCCQYDCGCNTNSGNKAGNYCPCQWHRHAQKSQGNIHNQQNSSGSSNKHQQETRPSGKKTNQAQSGWQNSNSQVQTGHDEVQQATWADQGNQSSGWGTQDNQDDDDSPWADISQTNYGPDQPQESDQSMICDPVSGVTFHPAEKTGDGPFQGW